MKEVFTSYFANLKNIPDDYEPIAICGGIPKWYKGKWLKKLAPSRSIWKEWHDSTAPDKDKRYARRFLPEVLMKLDIGKTVDEIFAVADGKVPVLLCYERPNEFCHRHLVAAWLNQSGSVKCEEFPTGGMKCLLKD